MEGVYQIIKVNNFKKVNQKNCLQKQKYKITNQTIKYNKFR